MRLFLEKTLWFPGGLFWFKDENVSDLLLKGPVSTDKISPASSFLFFHTSLGLQVCLLWNIFSLQTVLVLSGRGTYPHSTFAGAAYSEEDLNLSVARCLLRTLATAVYLSWLK